MAKICSKCKHSKPHSDFHKDKSTKDGLQRRCHQCQKEYVSFNREHIRAYERNYLKKNSKGAKRQAKYREKHGEIYRQKENAWARSKKGRGAYKSSKYRADKLKRTPKWLTTLEKNKIKELYRNCPTGYHVDHIIPLRGKNVSGLHVLSNLQYLPIKTNLKKSNKF